MQASLCGEHRPLKLESDQELEEGSPVGRDRFTKSPEDEPGVSGTKRKTPSSPKP